MIETIVIRKAFDDDYERAVASAFRFSRRHSLRIDTLDEAKSLHYTLRRAQLHVIDQLQDRVDNERLCQNGDARLYRLWLACFRRAVDEPSATGFGGLDGGRIIETRRMP